MMSNNGLNSNEAREERTATNSSVMLSGIRREKEAPVDFDIDDHSTEGRKSEGGDGSQRTEVSGRRLEIAVNRQNMLLAVGRNTGPEYVLFGARLEPGLLK